MLAALYAIFISIILLMAGWWLASLDDWFIWGMVLMGLAFLGLLKNIFEVATLNRTHNLIAFRVIKKTLQVYINAWSLQGLKFLHLARVKYPHFISA